MSVKVGKPSSERYAEQLAEDVATLREIGCSVSVEEGSAQALAIIDECIVQHGSIPPLALPKSDDCSLRFKSSEVAFDLLQSEAEDKSLA